MRVMVIVKADGNSEAGAIPDTKLLADMGQYNEALVKAGVMKAGEGLHPSSKGVRVRFAGAKRSVTPGPFGDPKHLVAGFWMWQVANMDEAIAWAKKCPFYPADGAETELEIRPVFEAEDFGEAMTPELREQEERMRREVEGR